MLSLDNPRILFVGGGSIGHIAPSVAVWNALKTKHSGATAHFVCSTKHDDQEFLTKNALPFTAVDSPRLSISLLWKYWQAKRDAKAVLSKFRPHVVFSKGGYVSVPLCAAATSLGIPIVLHESDSVGGRANTLVARWAKEICTGFRLTGDKYTYTGNPIRPSMTQGHREEGLALTGCSGDRPILLVTGGSQGAQSINEVIIKLLPELLKMCDVIHITGRGKGSAMQKEGYFSVEFAHEELADLYAISDIAISRAGASNIGELAANSIATILIPLRGVGHDHQQKNALAVEKEGACVVVQQENMEETLLETLKAILEQPEKSTQLQKNIAALYNQHAAEEIAETIMKCIA